MNDSEFQLLVLLIGFTGVRQIYKRRLDTDWLLIFPIIVTVSLANTAYYLCCDFIHSKVDVGCIVIKMNQ